LGFQFFEYGFSHGGTIQRRSCCVVLSGISYIRLESPWGGDVAKVLSAESTRFSTADGTVMSSIKSAVERVRALEGERRNLLLEIEELKKMADAKAKALESEINMLRDEVKELRLLLGGNEEVDPDLGPKKRR
jgi:hypothetical protein